MGDLSFVRSQRCLQTQSSTAQPHTTIPYSTRSMSVQTKVLIQMSGAPGSGKSTMARLLRPCLASAGAVVVDHDVLRSAFLASGLDFAAAARHAYELQWTLAEDLMRQGLSVIVDSTCNFPETLACGAALGRAPRPRLLVRRVPRARHRCAGQAPACAAGVDAEPAHRG